MHYKKSYLLSTIEKIFWVVYIAAPIFTGILSYNWLSNESPEEGTHEILTSYTECDIYEQCAEIPDSWRNIKTGNVYTHYDFEKHKKGEGNKLALKFIGYGLVGYIFYYIFRFFRDKERSINDVKLRKLMTLGYIKGLNPKDFPNISILSNDDILNMIENMQESKYDLSLKDKVKIYEQILANELNRKE